MRQSAAKPGLLVVDDVAVVRDLLAQSLEEHYDIETADSGEAALVLLGKREFAVLLADQRMPGMTGVTLAAKARELQPHLVTILLSAYSDPQDFIAAINHGQIFRFVSKPWDLGDLLLTLQQAVERHRLSRDNARLVAELGRRLHALEILQSMVGAAMTGATPHPAAVLLERLRSVVPFDLAAALVVPESGAAATLELKSRGPVSQANLIELGDQATNLYTFFSGTRLEEERLRPAVDAEVADVPTRRVESQVEVPLSRDGRVVGVLLVQSFEANAYSDDVRRLLDLLANGTARALHELRAAAGREWGRVGQTLAALPEGIILVDGTGELLLANPAAERLLQGAGAPDLLKTVGSADNIDGVEVQLSGRTLRVSAKPTFGSSEEGPGRLVLVRDVSAEKESETRRRRFVSTISHEIRTPLSSIVASIDLLLHGLAGNLTDRQRQYLTAAARACESLNHVVDELLDIEKHATGAVALSLRPVTVAGLIREALQRFRAAGEEAHVGMKGQGLDDRIVLSADPVRLEQLIGNLVSNAIKFGAASTDVTVSLAASNEPEGWAVLGVHNLGPVIAPQDLGSVFDRFAIPTPARRGGQRSSGLGLSICRSIAEAHGGAIFVDSGGDGTSFWSALPLAGASRDAGRVDLAAPLWVQAKDRVSAVSLAAILARRLSGVRLLPADAGAAQEARRCDGAGLVVTLDPECQETTRILLATPTLQAAQQLAEALSRLARRPTPELELGAAPSVDTAQVLQALGVSWRLTESGPLVGGPDLETMVRLAEQLPGASARGRLRALLRRATTLPECDVVYALSFSDWEAFAAAYGPARAAALRHALHGALEKALDPTPGRSIFAGFDAGAIAAGQRAALAPVVARLSTTVPALVRLHCRREDRDNGYLQLGPRRVPLVGLSARAFAPSADEVELANALSLPS